MSSNFLGSRRASEIAGVEMHQLATLEVYRHEIVRGLGRWSVARGMILDSQLFCGNHDPQIAVVLVVIVLQHQLVGAALGRLDDLRSPKWCAPLRECRDIMPAVPADQVWDLSSIILPGPRKALIVMNVSG